MAEESHKYMYVSGTAGLLQVRRDATIIFHA